MPFDDVGITYGYASTSSPVSDERFAIEIRQLRYFAAAYVSGSISKAADQLFLSQPALSRQIAELEREFGVTLFDRRRNGVVPTDAGVAMFRHARRVLQLIDSSRDVAAAASGVREVVDIGLAPGLPPDWVADLVTTVHHDVAKAALIPTDAATLEQFRFVRDGRLDISIAHQSPPPGLVGQLLRRDAFGVALAPQERPGRQAAVTWAALHGVEVLAHSRDQVSATHDRLTTAAELGGARPSWHFCTYTENAAACALATGATASLLTQSSASRLLPDWHWLPLSDPSVDMETWLVMLPVTRTVVGDVADSIIAFAGDRGP